MTGGAGQSTEHASHEAERAAVREARRRSPLQQPPPQPSGNGVAGRRRRRWEADEWETLDELRLYEATTIGELRAKCRREGGVSSGEPLARDESIHSG